jgi:hypothetical protein
MDMAVAKNWPGTVLQWIAATCPRSIQRCTMFEGSEACAIVAAEPWHGHESEVKVPDSLHVVVSSFQALNVDQVLRASRSAFVSNQILSTENEHRHSTERRCDLVAPSLVESNTIDFGKNVDANWGNADLKDGARRGQVIDTKRTRRGTKLNKCSVYAGCIFNGRPYPNVEIFGRSYEAMRCECMRTHNERFNVVV